MKTTTQEIELLTNYRYLINSISHFRDVKNLDQRMFSFTIHVNKASDLKAIRKVIPLKLNKLITGDTYSTSSSRPAIIIADDVEGSRDSNPNLTNPVYPHTHGVLTLSQETMDQTQDMKKFIADMENTILEINEVRTEAAHWDAKLIVSDPNTLQPLLSILKMDYPQIVKTSHISGVEAGISISRKNYRNASDCEILLEEMKSKYPVIESIERITDRRKMVDIQPYDYRGSVFNMCSYSMKLMGQSGNTDFDFRVHPFEGDINNSKQKKLAAGSRRKAEMLFNMAHQVPSILFSEEYLDEFKDEFALIGKLAERDRQTAT